MSIFRLHHSGLLTRVYWRSRYLLRTLGLLMDVAHSHAAFGHFLKRICVPVLLLCRCQILRANVIYNFLVQLFFMIPQLVLMFSLVPHLELLVRLVDQLGHPGQLRRLSLESELIDLIC